VSNLKRILVVEDETAIREFIVFNLKRSGYLVSEAGSGEDGLEIISNQADIDIALLDVMLPGIDGFEVCKKIREMNKTIGIIILTAKSQEMDKVTGLITGADDYITKPFSPTELIARIDSLYRRVSVIKSENRDKIIRSGPFALNLQNRTLTKNNKNVELTQVEFLILKCFLENSSVALSRESILDIVWGEEYFGELKIVDVNIRRLRMKIEDEPSIPKYIQTIWGYGYKWGVEE
jgi:DNA-binding response OmpR family regulator